MNANKVTVAMLKSAGFKFVADEYSVHRTHISSISKPPTPDQLAEKERYDWVENVCEEVGISDDFIVGQMYDAGYRK